MTDENGSLDQSTHHLINLHQPPQYLVLLRQELLKHEDILREGMKGRDFSECLGIIAAQLDIALDGDYEVNSLCKVLYTALQNRGKFSSNPSLRADGLLDVELIEREGSLSLVKRDREIITIVDDGVLIFEHNAKEKEPEQVLDLDQTELSQPQQLSYQPEDGSQEEEHHPLSIEETSNEENESSQIPGSQ